jgi:uncharacterized protein YkwD
MSACLFRRAVPVLLFVLLAPGLVSAQAPDNGKLDSLRRLAVDLLNGERRQRNLPVFTPDARLEEAAQHHAEDMATRQYYSHTSPRATR